ncbi:MAG: hypothetical protein ACRD0Z_03260 [Acidimicrobiales bacterium]
MTSKTDLARIIEIRDRYRRLAIEWSEARDDPTLANRRFRAHHSFYKDVRKSAEGQLAISGLLGDLDDAVRLLAATHSLGWNRDAAVEVLSELERGTNLYALDAEYTLKSFLEGKLNLDW